MNALVVTDEEVEVPFFADIPDDDEVDKAMTTDSYDPSEDVTDDDIRDRQLSLMGLVEDDASGSLFLHGQVRRTGMRELVVSFPSLRFAYGVDPWDALEFLHWSEGGHLTSGSVHAVRFVLQVWNANADWAAVAEENGIGSAHLIPFNVVAAFAAWDQQHRDAFLAWCREPFFP